MLDGLVALLTGTYAAAVPILRETQRAFEDGMSQTEQLRWMWGGTVSAMHLWDDEGWERAVRTTPPARPRDRSARRSPQPHLSHRGQMHVFAGELATAASLHDAIQDATELTGTHFGPYHGVGMVAMRGREAEAKQFIDKARAEVIERGEGPAYRSSIGRRPCSTTGSGATRRR